jgi:hypothetical protein
MLFNQPSDARALSTKMKARNRAPVAPANKSRVIRHDRYHKKSVRRLAEEVQVKSDCWRRFIAATVDDQVIIDGTSHRRLSFRRKTLRFQGPVLAS